jgi:hypothetical protein
VLQQTEHFSSFGSKLAVISDAADPASDATLAFFPELLSTALPLSVRGFCRLSQENAELLINTRVGITTKQKNTRQINLSEI